MPGPKVLLVEDDEDIGLLVSQTLRLTGYQVTWSKDGVQALSLAKASPPDLIVTDFMFPAGGGANLVQRVRMAAQTQSVPIIILSGVPKAVIAAAVAADAATYYLSKPYKKADLLALVEGVAAGSDFPGFHLHPRPAEGAVPSAKPPRGTILVIAEGEADRALLRGPLSGKNFRVVETADGAEALIALGLGGGSAVPEVLRPDLVILDAQTDLGGGHVLNARLMQEQATRSIPVLVVTATKEMRAAFIDATNVSAFLDKPVDAARLLRHVDELVPAKPPTR